MSIARAFVNRPLILLADEPTGNLDPATSVGIMRLLDRINRTGTTVVMATHDRSIVDTMRRRVIELDRGHDRPRPGARRLRVAAMALNLNYIVRETGANLKRNPTLTLASVLTISVSLAPGRRVVPPRETVSRTPPCGGRAASRWWCSSNPDITPAQRAAVGAVRRRRTRW